jgi:hypothetical protein
MEVSCQLHIWTASPLGKEFVLKFGNGCFKAQILSAKCRLQTEPAADRSDLVLTDRVVNLRHDM